jgi:hypothetical protein
MDKKSHIGFRTMGNTSEPLVNDLNIPIIDPHRMDEKGSFI